MKNNQAGALLARYTFLREHPSLQHCDFELGKVDWAYIDAQEWNQPQLILIEILRFLMTNTGNVQVEDINYLSDVERHAVVMALSEKYSTTELEENLAR